MNEATVAMEWRIRRRLEAVLSRTFSVRENGAKDLEQQAFACGGTPGRGKFWGRHSSSPWWFLLT
jgi:hypothetical protein